MADDYVARDSIEPGGRLFDTATAAHQQAEQNVLRQIVCDFNALNLTRDKRMQSRAHGMQCVVAQL